MLKQTKTDRKERNICIFWKWTRELSYFENIFFQEWRTNGIVNLHFNFDSRIVIFLFDDDLRTAIEHEIFSLDDFADDLVHFDVIVNQRCWFSRNYWKLEHESRFFSNRMSSEQSWDRPFELGQQSEEENLKVRNTYRFARCGRVTPLAQSESRIYLERLWPDLFLS